MLEKGMTELRVDVENDDLLLNALSVSFMEICRCLPLILTGMMKVMVGITECNVDSHPSSEVV